MPILLARRCSIAWSIVAFVASNALAYDVRFDGIKLSLPSHFRVIAQSKTACVFANPNNSSVRMIGFPPGANLNAATVQRLLGTHLKATNVRLTSDGVENGKDLGRIGMSGFAIIGEQRIRFQLVVIQHRKQVFLAVTTAADDAPRAESEELMAILDSITQIESNDRSILVFDFEQPGLANTWVAQGKIKLARGIPPAIWNAPKRNGAGEFSRPSRHAMHVQTAGKSVFATRPGQVPKDWTSFESISFWIYRPEGTTATDTIEVQALQSRPSSRFWRKVTVDHHGWKHYKVPLRWMRWSNSRVPRWREVVRFGLYFRTESNVWLDTITLDDLDATHGTQIANTDLIPLAFGDTGNAQVADNGHVALIHATPDLAAAQLIDHLTTVKKRFKSDFSFLPATTDTPKIVIARTRPEYARFVKNLATRLNSQVAIPSAAGFTLHGIATSYWDPKQGTLRPVYTHEFVHAMLTPILRVSNKSEWFHEGIASYYQLNFHPQANLVRIVRQGIENRNAASPLAELCNGQSIAPNRYWQAMTLVNMLINDPRYKQELPKLVQHFQETGSTDLQPVLANIYGKTWQQLTEDWRTFCISEYPQ